VSDVDQAAFRRATGQFPGGIVVVTTSAGHAMTVSAFASVSLSMLVGVHTASADRAVRDWTEWLLGQPLGEMAVGAIGIAIMITGACIGVVGVRAEFRQRIARPQAAQDFLQIVEDRRRNGTAEIDVEARPVALAVIG